MIKVLIADDHPVFRDGLKRLLDNTEDLECVACAAGGEEALKLATEMEVDVALLDVAMPGLDGVEAAKRIKQARPDISIIILSAYDYPSYVSASLSAGASGYLLKDSDFRDIISAVHFVNSGKAVFHVQPVDSLNRNFFTSGDGTLTLPSKLTNRELEILVLIAKGYSNKSIARHLDISRRTVDGYVSRIFEKLGVGSRTEAVLDAIIAGWLTVEEIRRK